MTFGKRLLDLANNLKCTPARQEHDFIQRGLQLGAAAYLSKPYVLSELLATIKSQIGD